MKKILSSFPYFVVCLLFTLCLAPQAQSAQVEDYISNPPFSTASVPPNVVVMLDNSGSMKSSMYSGGYKDSTTYSGMFDSNTNYQYDTTIAVDDSKYDGGTAEYDVDIDTSKTGAFVADSSCDVYASFLGHNCWKGNFLNWLTTRRIDSARMVLVGGKIENRDGYDYLGNGTDSWKIVGNNEPEDRDLGKTATNSSTYSPFPSSAFNLTSPTEDGAVDTSGNGYDPYGKIQVTPAAMLFYEEQQVDDGTGSGTTVATPVIIGEMVQTGNFKHGWKTITFQNTYSSPPIVVAGPLSYNETDGSTIRIRNVTTTTFQIRIREYEHEEGVAKTNVQKRHANERVFYIAMEAGSHQLIDGPKVYAGQQTLVDENWSNTIDISAGGFTTPPAILAIPTTVDNNGNALNPRLRNVTTTDFDVRLQRQENNAGAGSGETVDFIAAETGPFSSTLYGYNIQVGVHSVDDSENRSDFTNGADNYDISGGLLVATMQTYDDPDPAGLRLTDEAIIVEEDISSDAETGHGAEDIGYFHVTLDSTSEFNVAVITTIEPTGLMHNVYETVRLGTSFYNYQYQSSNIYKGETNDGGTLRLKIPKNPFIKRPYLDDAGDPPADIPDEPAAGDDTTAYDGAVAQHAEAEAKFRTVDTYVRGKLNDTSSPTESETGLSHIVDAIEHYPLVWGTTPIAENLVEVANYFRQSSNYEYGDQIDYIPYDVDDSWDPYVITNGNAPVDCLESFILIFTDGYPFKDACVPVDHIADDNFPDDNDGRICDQDSGSERDAEDNLDNVAEYLHNDTEDTIIMDLRDGTAGMGSAIAGNQDLNIYTVGFANGTIRPILQRTADNGGGTAHAAADGNSLSDILIKLFNRFGNATSSGTAAGVVSQSRSGVGAIYQALFYQEKGETEWIGELQTLLIDDYGNLREDTDTNQQLTNEDDMIVVFQDDSTVDLYKDPDGNGAFSYNCDASPVPTSCSTADADCNGYDDTDEATCNGAGDVACYASLTPCQDLTTTVCMECGQNPDTIAYLWKASDWLNTASDVLTQRDTAEFTEKASASTDSPNDYRYLFTFIDEDEDMVVDSGEQIPFTCTTDAGDADNDGCDATGVIASPSVLDDDSKIFPYLTLYSSTSGTGDPTDSWEFSDQLDAMMGEEIDETNLVGSGSTVFSEFLHYQAEKLINFTRGEDQDEDSVGAEVKKTFNGVVDYEAPFFRKRTVDASEWRLGDAIYSTPTMIASPKEAYHLLYRDRTYATFAGKYQYRRGVVYMGTNDGIFHAFNAGFFRESHTVEETDGTYTNYSDKFWENCALDADNDLICEDDEKYIDLGAELWGYIPYNLLPHLFWLTDLDYDTSHVYFNDLKPRVFDAKIFTEEAICSTSADGRLDDACLHPYGWGTVLVGGMRLGGGEIRVDMDKADTSTLATYDTAVDRTMSSAYFILDITNPEAPPELLGEITFPGLGYTTCYPTAVPVRNKSNEADLSPNTDNRWFLVFGNGPNDLEDAGSTTTGKVYVVDLNDLGKGAATRQLTTLSYDSSSSTTSLLEYDPSTSPTHVPYAQELEANTFVSDPIAVDYDLDFKADAVYFGTVSGTRNNWSGKMRRIEVLDSYNPTTWDLDSVLLDLTSVDIDGDSTADNGQPITAAASVALDKQGNRWLFFGTGRYFVEYDEADLDDQSYYGVKEPWDSTSSSFTWATVARDDLEDVTDIWVTDIDNITDELGNGITGISDTTDNDWDELLEALQANPHGWRLDFPDPGERNIGQAALLGEVLTFTTYVPPDVYTNPCLVDGESYLWGLYYETGTSYHEEIFSSEDTWTPTDDMIDKRVSVGQGVAISPNLHVGRDAGSKAVMQTSTGQIKIEQQTTPGFTKSGKASWLERR